MIRHAASLLGRGCNLAFIHVYALLNSRPLAEGDMQRFFRVSGPAVHQMPLDFGRARISRQPGPPRSIRLRLPRTQSPELCPANQKPVRTTV